MARRHRSKEEWEALLLEFAQSGQSAKQWTEERGICYPSLLQWKKKLAAPTSFVELKELPHFELRWKGIRIELSSFEELRELGEVLVRC